MNAPDRILAATDLSAGAAAAVERAALLAGTLGGELHLLHVVSSGALQALAHLFSGRHDDARERLVAAARTDLEATAVRLAERHRIEVGTSVRVGDVLGEILAAADAQRCTVLVCGARGAHALREFLIGTTTERALRRARRPVLTVKRRAHEAYRRVLVPVDFSPCSRAALQLAHRTAPGAEITVLHAFEVPFEARLRFAGVDEDEILRYRRNVREEAQRSAEALLASSGVPRDAVSLEIQHGYAPQVIAAAERRIAADLVVAGKHGQSLLEELLLGSVTRRILAASRCDVLVATHPGDAD